MPERTPGQIALERLLESGYFNREQASINHRLEELIYVYAVITVVFGIPLFTRIFTRTEAKVRFEMTLKDLLREERLIVAPPLERVARGVASRCEDRLRSGRPLSKSLGESVSEKLTSVRRVKRLAFMAPVSDHMILAELTHPEFFPNFPLKS
ncbi:hypothetical protein HY387_01140 [Candidatus Daviesbacteria bacterium]|nr:hypothetical protein [Candidatus Daviesbacteria bacterium]